MSTPHSLRLRLLGGGAAWIVLALAASWIFVLSLFTQLIENERRSDLQVAFDRLVASIDPDADDPLLEGVLTDPRYDTPLGGLYWQVRDMRSGNAVRSRSMWDIELPGEPNGETAEVYQFTPVGGPTLIVLSQLIRSERSDGSERTFAVSVAEERTNEDDPITTFGRALATFLSILAITLVAAAALQVNFGLKPLATLREHIAAVRDGTADRLPVGSSRELRPLTEQVNELLDAQEASMNFVRERASDLAHGLKTPLAVLGATADRLRKQGDSSSAETLRLLVDQMNERVDYQLRIARLRLRTRAQGVHASINDAVVRSVSVMRNAPDSERISWLVDMENSLDVSIDRHDLMEFIGILLENAQQWAAQQVMVRGHRLGDKIELLVEDDGKGLGDEQIARLGKRGVRLDESRGGDGLGLAIAFEICRLNSAEISLGRSVLGGLKVQTHFAI